MEVIRTTAFERRVQEISDREAVIRIDVVAQRMRRGIFGDWKNVGHGVMETRIHYAAGIASIGLCVVPKSFSCCYAETSGDKRTQRRDIAQSIILSETLKLEC